MGNFDHLLLGHSAYRLGTLLRGKHSLFKGLAQIPGFQPAQVVGHGAEGIGDAHFRGVQILRAEITLMHRLKLPEDFLPGLFDILLLHAALNHHNALVPVIGGGTVIAQAQLFPDVQKQLGMGRAAEQGGHEPHRRHIPAGHGDAGTKAMAKIIDGKAVSAAVRAGAKQEVEALKAQGIQPGLAVVIVGDDPASRVYVNNKKKACAEIGIHSEEYALPKETTQEELLDLVRRLNDKKDINGILVQLPLPKGLDEKEVIETISPLKDVDAFHPQNVGRIMIGDYHFLPCTPAGVMELLKSADVEICGRDCVVIGRSNIVGKPMAMLLLHQSGTVTICHSKTQNLKEVCRRADILVAAVGIPKFVTADMVKPGAVVIDVGMDRDENGKLCGDVDFQNVEPIASAITPVPGGVGPMTIAMLMKNTIRAAKLQNKKR